MGYETLHNKLISRRTIEYFQNKGLGHFVLHSWITILFGISPSKNDAYCLSRITEDIQWASTDHLVPWIFSSFNCNLNRHQMVFPRILNNEGLLKNINILFTPILFYPIFIWNCLCLRNLHLRESNCSVLKLSPGDLTATLGLISQNTAASKLHIYQ